MRASKMEVVKVGEKIKALRQEANISLQDLAEKCGYSTAVLSQIENHLVSPSLGVLVHLAKAMEVNIGTFFGKEETEPFTLIRKGEEHIVSRFASKEGVRYGYTYESLGAGKKDRRMEPFMITLEPATIKNDKCYGHEGEEFIYVLDGRIDVTPVALNPMRDCGVVIDTVALPQNISMITEGNVDTT
ncbi:MAG: XRE family transcriptional regulator, partial [Pseudomonadota bacterium]|nr:XRE family transcriptional regulator [Pseudomonadota bacterium]